MIESRAQIERNGDGIAFRPPEESGSGTLRDRSNTRAASGGSEAKPSSGTRKKRFTIATMWPDMGYTPYQNDIGHYTIGWKRENFVAQSNPDLCWAAAFAMASRHLDLPNTEREFFDANRTTCGSSDRSATLNQIVHAVTSVYMGRGVWVSDPDGTQEAWVGQQVQQAGGNLFGRVLGLPGPGFMPTVPPPPSLWFGQNWYRDMPNGERIWGGVFLLTKPSQLLRAQLNHNPVIVGYKQGGGMHVVLLVGLWARPGGPESVTGAGIDIDMGTTKIETAEVVDPRGSGEPYSMSGDEFIEKSLFAIEVRR
jgi:hypothetical protein